MEKDIQIESNIWELVLDRQHGFVHPVYLYKHNSYQSASAFHIWKELFSWQTLIWFPASPHQPTLRLNNPTEAKLFNSAILHSWFSRPTWQEFTAGGSYVWVCAVVGGCLSAWVLLSTVIIWWHPVSFYPLFMPRRRGNFGPRHWQEQAWTLHYVYRLVCACVRRC